MGDDGQWRADFEVGPEAQRFHKRFHHQAAGTLLTRVDSTAVTALRMGVALPLMRL